jgi:rod shape-determining protein MreC
VAAFGTGARHLQGRGGSPGFRFTLYALLSIVIMFLDERSHWLENARYFLQAAAYPVQLAVSSPSAAWSWLQQSTATRDELRKEINQLRAQQREVEIRSMRFDALQKENAELRGLKEALPAVAERWEVAEVVNVELNSLRQRVLLNRGTSNGVFKGQAVMDEKGLLGQTLHVGPWSSEVILITDPEHAVPVQIERNGLRTIAVGAGDTASLALPYLPANADVKTGDLLVTSGLGGVFPAGYPVARITEVHHDAVQPLAQVRARPLAGIDLDREAVLVWFRPDHPAAPGPATLIDSKSGNARIQPLPAPPHLAAAANAEPGAGTAAPANAAASGSKSAAALKPAPATRAPASAAAAHAAGARSEAPGPTEPAPRAKPSPAAPGPEQQ